jgi:NRPS condensation-like uncharacterized protein
MLLKATHQVCDAGGLMEIAADLSGIYSGLTNDPSYRPRPNLQGSRGVGQILRHVPRSAFPAIFLNFLQSIRSNPKTHTLPLAHGPRAPISFLIRHLSASRAARIIEYGRQHQATINDLLLAAFYRAQAAVGKWDGKAALRAKIMIDLRRWYLPMERAEGICNLSSYEFINIGRDLGDDFDSTLARVCAATRRRKASWLGLADVWLVPLFNRLPYRWLVKMAGKTIRQKSARKKLPNGITNVGPIQPQAVSFGGPPLKAWFLPPVVYPPFFGIHLSGYSGSLTISSGFPQPILPLVEQFFDRLMAELPE